MGQRLIIYLKYSVPVTVDVTVQSCGSTPYHPSEDKADVSVTQLFATWNYLEVLKLLR